MVSSSRTAAAGVGVDLIDVGVDAFLANVFAQRPSGGPDLDAQFHGLLSREADNVAERDGCHPSWVAPGMIAEALSVLYLARSLTSHEIAAPLYWRSGSPVAVGGAR